MSVKDFWDVAAHIGNILGLIGAAVWAYFNFIKSRTYMPRMEMTVSGQIAASGHCRYLIPRVTLKNIGKSKIVLRQSGTGYRVWIATQKTTMLQGELDWQQGQKVYEIFDHHLWIEPEETVFDETRAFSMPLECVAVKIEARVVAPDGRGFVKRSAGWFRKKLSKNQQKSENNEWNCSAVIAVIEKSIGDAMSKENEFQKQEREQRERTERWENDKMRDVTDQEPENPQRTREWDRHKQPSPGKEN